MILYAIYAKVTTFEKDGDRTWSCVKQIPTFYLSAAVQGIVDEKHAEKIAGDIICPGRICGDSRVTIDALKIEV